MPEYKLAPNTEHYRVGTDGSVWVFMPGSPVDKRFPPRWKELKSTPDRSGYRQVTFKRGTEGEYKTWKVHRLVLETFVGPCPEGMECRHRDNNRANNELSNLHWGTHADNIRDKIAHGTIIKGEQHHASKLTVADVIDIRAKYEAGQNYDAIAAEKNVTRGAIILVVQRKRWAHVA